MSPRTEQSAQKIADMALEKEDHDSSYIDGYPPDLLYQKGKPWLYVFHAVDKHKRLTHIVMVPAVEGEAHVLDLRPRWRWPR